MIRKRMNGSALLILIGMVVLMSVVYLYEEVLWYQLALFFLVLQFIVFKLELYMKRFTYKWLVFISLWLFTLSTITIQFLIGERVGQSLALVSMSLVSIGILRIYIDIERYKEEYSRELYQWMLIPLLTPLLIYGIIDAIETAEMGGWKSAGFLILIAFIAKSISSIENEPEEDAFVNTSYLAGTLYFMFLVSGPNFWAGIIGLGALAGYILLMINEQTSEEELEISISKNKESEV